MPNHTMHAIIVSGINSGSSEEPILDAFDKAKSMFDPELLALTEPGHNFVQSFCVFPTGSGQGREPQIAHEKAVEDFCSWLTSQGTLEFVAVKWQDCVPACITHTSEE